MVPELEPVAAACARGQCREIDTLVEAGFGGERQRRIGRVRCCMCSTRQIDEGEPRPKRVPLGQGDVFGGMRAERVVGRAPLPAFDGDERDERDGRHRPDVQDQGDVTREVRGSLDQDVSGPQLPQQRAQVPGAGWRVVADGHDRQPPVRVVQCGGERHVLTHRPVAVRPAAPCARLRGRWPRSASAAHEAPRSGRHKLARRGHLRDCP